MGAQSPQQRILAIDAARGFAMLMVFVNHITQHLEATAPTLYFFLHGGTRLATPTFLLLSGFVIRVVLGSDRRGKAPVMLIDRALFLLLVAHALLGLSDLPRMTFTEWVFGRMGPVEAIAFALPIAVLLRRARAATFLGLGVSLFVLAWILDATVDPQATAPSGAGPVLAGLIAAGGELAATPLVNYVGIFLIGMGISASLHEDIRARNNARVRRRLFIIGACGVTAAIAGVLAWHWGKDHVAALLADPVAISHLRQTLNPEQKDPPGPGYLLFYGGLGILALGCFFSVPPTSRLEPAVRAVAVIGRASLMCFVVQQWLFFDLVTAAGLDRIRFVPFWFAYLAVCVAVLFGLANLWDRASGNRFLTVGLRALARRRAQRPKEVTPEPGPSPTAKPGAGFAPAPGDSTSIARLHPPVVDPSPRRTF